MPQATDELRDKMAKYFGDPIDDSGPMIHLLRAGYTEKAGLWSKPTPAHKVTQKERDCLNFLCDEWDYAYDFRGQE